MEWIIGLLDGLYSVSDIQDYLKYILKKHGEKTGNSSTRIYLNKIENRITFKMKTDKITRGPLKVR